MDEYLDREIDNGVWGSRLKNSIESYLKRMSITAAFEILPNKENTLVLDENDTDPFGLPLPVSKIKWSSNEYRVKRYIEKRFIKKAPEVIMFLTGYGINGNHPYGTYRMGENNTQGVVDHNLKSFDHQNLYIFGGGSFVTGTCLNPTLTIAALAFKSLNTIKL